MTEWEPQKAVPRRLLLKWTLWSLLALGVLLVFLIRYDSPLDPAEDLKPRRPLLQDNSRNGFIQLMRKWESSPLPDHSGMTRLREMARGTEPWDQAFLDAVNFDAGAWEKDLSEALAMEHWQLQSAVPGQAVDSAYVNGLAQRCQLFCCFAVDQFRRGQTTRAVQQLTLVETAARRSFQGATSMLDGLMAHAIASGAVSVACFAGSLPDADQATLHSLRKLMESWQTAPADVSEVLRHEYQWGITQEDPELKTLSKWKRLFYKPNQCCNLITRLHRRLEPLYLVPDTGTTPAITAEIHRILPDRTRLNWMDLNRTGKKLLRNDRDSWKTPDQVVRSGLAVHRAAAVCLALRQWQNHHGGNLPGRLEDLVPEFLEAVPQDPFDGKPLRWNPVQGFVYSVGSDLQDDPPAFYFTSAGGAAVHVTPSSDSPGVRLLTPPPPAAAKGSP